jgi:hypothetical protein
MTGYTVFGTSATTTAASNGVWCSWNSVTSVTTTASSTWYTWNGTIEQSGTTMPAPIALSDEEIAARQAREEAYRREREEVQERARLEEERRQLADTRAKELLKSFLTPEQVKSVEEQSNFLVESENKRLFKIRKGHCYNILEVNQEGKSIARYCTNFGNPDIAPPDYDLMLAQKLILENNEALFLRTANREAL